MLSKEEQAWVNKLQKVLDACPKSLSKRAESYTIGDADITLFDNSKYICTESNIDVCVEVDRQGIELCNIRFPFGVWSTAG